jgi:hypothetical protein
MADPPRPAQDKVYDEPVVRAPVLWLPDVAFDPDHEPEAVQDVAFVEFQDKVEELPEAIEVGFAEIETAGGVGAGVGIAACLMAAT